MAGFYDYRLITLSVLIAVCAAYSALELAGRTAADSGRRRIPWLAGGAIAMGFGIWSMHYVGMLAFNLSVPVLYDWPTVLLSLLAAIFASAVAFFQVSRKKLSWPRVLIGSAIMGLGIATMHYTGMAAMRLPATCSYDPVLFVSSIILAVLISVAALWFTFQFKQARRSLWQRTGSALIMGSAISVMHYTAMAAARFAPSTEAPSALHAVSPSTLSFAGVSVVTVLISGVAVYTSAVDRRFSAQRLRLLESERRYHLLVNGIKDYAIFMLTPEGRVASWNPGAERITGYIAEEIVGRHFSCFYTQQDVEASKASTQLDRALRESKVEDQGWRVRKNGTRFWADIAITSLWDNAGRLQGFSKVVRDATERKRAEENLRVLSARLLQLRDEERRHIARELHDSAGQLIAAINMKLTPIADNGANVAEATRMVNESLGLLQQLSTEVRTISHLLHPPLLDEVGLASALRLYIEGFEERSKILVDCDIPDNFGRLSREMETTIFRLVQECLTNVHRHSRSKTAAIKIWHNQNDVHVQVEDAGQGISPEKRAEMEAARNGGVGVRGMRERVRQFGGTMKIDLGPNDRGTLISVRMPYEGPSTIPPEETLRQLLSEET